MIMALAGTSAHASTVTAPLAPAAPLTRAPQGHFVTPAIVNGTHNGKFVVDTGAGGCALYSGFVQASGIKARGSTQLTGQTGSSAVKLAKINSLKVAGVKTGPLECVILPPRRDKAGYAGIVGLDSMGAYVVKFDMPHHQLSFYPAWTNARSLVHANGHEVDASILPESGLLSLPVWLNGKKAIAVLDSGARRSIINPQLAKIAGVDLDILKPAKPIYGATIRKTDIKIGTLGTLSVAGDRADAFVGGAANLPVFKAFGVADQPAMILGLDYLSSHTMVVDFPNHRIYLSRP
ncbi:aspartyl protease family protein [Kordiimonas marina]|uniref:aspartyl protease family protein n=1 Tax=Kordiimonas marina TaxID=2872312 RepID=UPI001FF6C6E5|nr:aspartyl protease family protein [Kordiimonas marina]MCJ9428902.1 aspartyl protease family protein [Kordiimonas marina]